MKQVQKVEKETSLLYVSSLLHFSVAVASAEYTYTYFSNSMGHDFKTLSINGFLEEKILGRRELSVRFSIRASKNKITAVRIKTSTFAILQADAKEKCHATQI